MPTFVYLPGLRAWINLQRVDSIDQLDDGGLRVTLGGRDMDDQHREIPNVYTISNGHDEQIMLRALSKLTPKELT